MTLSCKVTLVLLAGGFSQRMGAKNKLLIPIDGRPVLVRALWAAQQAGLDTIVVTGYQAEAIVGILPPGTPHIHNERFDAGMGASIKAAARTVGPDRGIMILPGDMPYIRPDTMALIADQYDRNRIIVPVSSGRRGHPVLFGAAFHEELLHIDDASGARSVVEQNSDRVIELRADDAGIHRDIDTPDDLP